MPCAADLEGELLEHVKFSGITWTHDGLGFFYLRYEPPATSDAGTETGANLGQQLAYHLLGTPQSDDVTVWADPQHPTWMFGTEVTNDGRCAVRCAVQCKGRVVRARHSVGCGACLCPLPACLPPCTFPPTQCTGTSSSA